MNFSLAELFGPVAPPWLGDLWQVTVAQFAPIIPYLLLVTMLIFRPTGLIGRANRDAGARSLWPWLALAALFAGSPTFSPPGHR